MKKMLVIQTLSKIDILMARGFLIFSVFVLSSCSDSSPEVRPRSSAYNDGFEVVFVDDTGEASVVSLKELGSRIGEGTFLLNDAQVEKIESANSSEYPFVKLKVSSKNEGLQRITLSYHYSKNIYEYEYEASKEKVMPLISKYRDLTENIVIIYE